MANNKPNAIYAPGELDKVRGKLGVNDEEAKRMAQILGGEVGVEKNSAPGAGKSKDRLRREKVELVVGGKGGGRRPNRHVELDEPGAEKNAALSKPVDPGDDPAVHLKMSYFERVKMDRYAAQAEFEIKNSSQVFVSFFSFFSEPVDYVNPRFVTKRMNEYYRNIEQLVTSTRTLFPRNNAKRSERMKKASPFVYSVLDVIRNWNIERIIDDLSKLQASPRATRAVDFDEILRTIYKPLFVLEQLDIENHIKGSYRLLYKVLYLENPIDAQEKFQTLIRNAIASFIYIRRNVRFNLYPLLMKRISDRWFPFEQLFIDRRRRFMAFIKAAEDDQIKAINMESQQAAGDLNALKEDLQKEQDEAAGEGAENGSEENSNDPKSQERKNQEAERKALDRARTALEAVFPKAGWDRLEEYPDMYPYFADIYNLRKGYELIAPTDPLQQVAVLMHILEDLFIALRYAKFGTVTGSDGVPVGVEDYVGDIIINWRRFIDDSYLKDYLPRLVEYCRILENSAESRTSQFARKTLTELHWIRRLYFLPYYKFESFSPPPFQKKDIVAIYGEVRTLRKYLTLIAAGIEQATHQGGAEARIPCDGINNPWAAYKFEVPNPVSKRLDKLLPQSKRNNASLVFFSLAAVTILDYLINNEASWAYGGDRQGLLFRSIDGAGITPMFGVDNKIDADQIFKDSLKKKEG